MQQKIVSQAQAQQQVRRWQDAGLEVCFTNGCFDIVHYGHVSYLANAKKLADKLVVGLNSDASVSRLKGAHRPICNQNSRAYVMAALEAVDLVVIFEQDTPLELICALSPDILAKGGDYQPADIVGADWVLAHGGQVKSLNLETGYSTSLIEQKIKNSNPV